jgi:hypothetical protein
MCRRGNYDNPDYNVYNPKKPVTDAAGEEASKVPAHSS